LRRAIDRALKGLQSALGGLNDMQVHAQLARGFARANTATQKAFAIGYLRGSEDARASELLCPARAAGKRLKKAA
jgi:triphosphatase